MSDDHELEYYRQVEELFASLRGVPHVLSPRDFQLLRRWWRQEVPLEAVHGGLTEVFARRHQQGETDPVVSLTYCRHAVERHARRLAEMRVGAGAESTPAETGDGAAAAAVLQLAESLDGRARDLEPRWPRISEAIDGVAAEIRLAAALPAGAVEERLYDLEAALLAACWRALPPERRSDIERAADTIARSTATGDGVERTRRAMCDRELRRLLELPRLELDR